MNVRFLPLAAIVLTLACPATAQVAILQIQVVEGEGGVYPPGSRSSRPLIVEITDETGKPVAGAAVSFHLPEEGPGGVFLNGLRTDVVTTDAQGRAGLRGLQINRISGRFQIRIVASKEQARAGAVSFQYVAESAHGAGSRPGARGADSRPGAHGADSRPGAHGADSGSTARGAGSGPAAQGGHSRGKWLAAAALAGGGAVVAILVAGRAGSAAPPAAPPGPALTIGSPSITVGKP